MMKQMGMWKKLMAAILVVTVFSAMIAPEVDARRGGAFKSSRGTFQQTPSKAQQDAGTAKQNAVKSESQTKSSTAPATSSTGTNQGGLFGGGSFMKALMVGGLAGLLFGGLFGSLGMLGDILGLMVNLLAIYLIVAIGLHLYRSYKQRKQYQDRRY